MVRYIIILVRFLKIWQMAKLNICHLWVKLKTWIRYWQVFGSAPYNKKIRFFFAFSWIKWQGEPLMRCFISYLSLYVVWSVYCRYCVEQQLTQPFNTLIAKQNGHTHIYTVCATFKHYRLYKKTWTLFLVAILQQI